MENTFRLMTEEETEVTRKILDHLFPCFGGGGGGGGGGYSLFL